MDAYQSLRQQLRQRLAHLEGRLDTVEHDRRRDTNTLEPDWEEQATVRQNDEVLDELAEAERLQARAIRAALQRIEDGSYGQCGTCGEPIDPSSTVSELPFVYVQWSQAVTLFPVIQACKFVALQTPFAFMQ
jgi:DnaK suppressor protein